MAENLKTTKYNEGTSIAEVKNDTEWNYLTTPAYCWFDNDSTTNAKLFGALYNFYSVADTNSLNVCPVGWDVPTDAEWTILTDYLDDKGYGFGGSGADVGKSLAATFRWNNSSTAAEVGNDIGSNNSTGFAGLPSGYRNASGAFSLNGDYGFWWSSTVGTTAFAWLRYLYYVSDNVNRSFNDEHSGFSVRCLRD